MLVLLKIFARLLAWLPPALVEALCRVLGWLVRVFLPSRCRTTLRSLSHAFPEQTEAWRRRVFRASCARLMEMGLYRLAAAYFDQARMARSLEISPDAQQIMQKYEAGGRLHGRPVIIMLPHMTMSEAATNMPGRFEGLKPIHVIFRPLNQPSINRWVTQERERFGAKMISRRSGHNNAMAALRQGEMVAVLFDQDASKKGSAITFMDRVASATDLPALMAHRFGADVFLMLLERQSFWRAKLTLTPIPLGDAPVDVTIAAHDALEHYLRRNEETAADWLWLHDRWNFAYKPPKRFRLPEKRNQLARSNEWHGYGAVPRKTRLWIRLPNWLGDVIMAVPLIRALRVGRPDFEITLIGKSTFAPLIERIGVADRFIALPQRGAGYFWSFYGKRLEYPDTYLLLTNSWRGDIEAFLTRCPQRFGTRRPGKRRLLLTEPYGLPDAVDERTEHQMRVWERMLRAYGLRESPDCAPLGALPLDGRPLRLGLICGRRTIPKSAGR